jgi:hypothetical protein
VINTNQVIRVEGYINNGKKWPVREKSTKVTESDKMSNQPIVDQEMKDLERKDGRNTVTPPGTCARVVSLRTHDSKRMLRNTNWSNKSRKVCVQSGNWHREYGE